MVSYLARIMTEKNDVLCSATVPLTLSIPYSLTMFSFPPQGDFPFKYGTLMGVDAAGNRYYENRVDYPFGQHRWVEPGDIHNFDSTSIPPEWHGWMTSMNDAPPSQEEELIKERQQHVPKLCRSNAPADMDSNVGHQEPIMNFHHMHNQSQVRSRGYGIGNPIVGLPPGAKDSYYTQPGSPYNPASIRPLEVIGETPSGKGYKSAKWADRLMTPEEKAKVAANQAAEAQKAVEAAKMAQSKRMAALRSRGMGTVVGN